MASKFTNFLSNVGQGLTNPKGNLGDWRHAARLYIDDTFRLAPKTKFLFFVNFEISEAALNLYPQLKNRHLPEINMLCKTADLPHYSANVDVKNQYNRKKVVQSSIDYTPVTITMHDDNQGVTTYLLEAYYKYYYRDARGGNVDGYKTDAYGPRNTYSGERKFRYGLDNSTVVPFFKSIKLYQLSRQQFTEYTLVNPLLERWGHDSMDYADNAGTSENTMVLNYETVLYDRGMVSEDNPSTFATNHYDTIPSPLSIEGGGVENLFGAGGVLDGGSSILGDVANGEVGFGTLLTAANTVKNAKNLSKEGLKGEALGIGTGILGGIATGQGGSQGIQDAIGGVAGTIIPGAGGDRGNTTVALSPGAGIDGDDGGSPSFFSSVGTAAGNISNSIFGPSVPSVSKEQKLASARGRNTP